MKGLSERDLYPGEEDFFKSRPDVGGMIAEDGKVIINPFSTLSPAEKEAVFRNEKARHLMRSGAVERPAYGITARQREFFGKAQAGEKYGSDQDIRETIAARILTGDPSAQDVTDEQIGYVRGQLMADKNTRGTTEEEFQKGIRQTEWFKEFVAEYGEEPDLDTKDYDYRKAWAAGIRPVRDEYDGGRFHWGSSLDNGEMLKSADHPTAWKEHFMRATGKNPDAVGATRTDWELLQARMAHDQAPKGLINKAWSR